MLARWSFLLYNNIGKNYHPFLVHRFPLVWIIDKQDFIIFFKHNSRWH